MPLVSVIVPCFNEQSTIHLLLEAVCRQSFAIQDIEVIIADGLSTDRTRTEVAAFQSQHPELIIRLVDNPKRIIPAGLNQALAAAQGDYIIRLDAHSMPAQDYIARCIEGLRADKGENVGGVWEIKPRGSGFVERAIAIAASHPFGVGDARYRYANQAGYVDTVPFGSFKRQTFVKYGMFDENLLTNEDYEFNARLRQNGARVWLNPGIRSVYFARPDLASLAKQYWRYGFWKWRMLKRYPQTLRWRQALPPVFVAGVATLGILAFFLPLARILFAALLMMYLLVILAGSLPAASRNGDIRLAGAIMLAIAVMHFCWGAGFLWSLATSVSSLAEKSKLDR